MTTTYRIEVWMPKPVNGGWAALKGEYEDRQTAEATCLRMFGDDGRVVEIDSGREA